MPIPIAVKLPYTLHTNRELGLMLAGKKPLARFCDAKDQFPEVVLRYLRLFDRYIANGTLVRADQFEEPNLHRSFTLHCIHFALPGEVWRIAAMIELHASPKWSLAHERREGELLGYADWMNDHWIGLFPQ